MDNVIYPVLVALILGLGGWVAGRLSVKTKTQTELEKVSDRVKKLEGSHPLVLKCLLAILLGMKRGKVNGECDEALDELNRYFCERE